MNACRTALFRLPTAAGAHVEIELRVRGADPRLVAAVLEVCRRAASHAARYAIEEGGLDARDAPVAGPPVAWDMQHISKGNTNEH